ncbi:MAG: uridine diphosphate-N-acetylglucosamine-binding protein YvcK [Deinococcota bacterium]
MSPEPSLTADNLMNPSPDDMNPSPDDNKADDAVPSDVSVAAETVAAEVVATSVQAAMPPSTERRKGWTGTPLARLSRWRLWLVPGMGVKRHVMMAVLGTLLLVVGAVAGVLWGLQGNRQVLSEPIEQVLVSRNWRVWGGWLALVFSAVGVVLAVRAVSGLNHSLLSNWVRQPHDVAVVIHRQLSLSKGPRIVALGGGTGLSNLLRGLRDYTSNITAVVAVSDDGGSSGRLRAAFDMPAPGDLVDCLAALSDNELEVGKLLEYRFNRGGELKGHTFGNLFITTLMEVEGDFAQAVRVLNSILNICGVVYPMSAEAAVLEAFKTSGKRVIGESKVSGVPGSVQRVALHPERPREVPEVATAISQADLVVLGPGSLFTSTLPPLLVPETREALARTNALVVYVCNVMTEAGETDDFSVWDHVEALAKHAGRFPDRVVVNSTPVDASRLERYRAEGAELVDFDVSPFRARRLAVDELDVLSSGLHAQHDSELLARWLIQISKGHSYRPPNVVELKA